MSYKNGKDVLPARLLKELQQYIQGELLYIPKPSKKRAGWGEMNGTKREMEERNLDIYRRYSSGTATVQLMQMYHLSEDSIRKIVFKTRNALQNGQLSHLPLQTAEAMIKPKVRTLQADGRKLGTYSTLY